MNIKYKPQKSEKFSFIGLLLGCTASILIFLLLSSFLMAMHVNKDESRIGYLLFSIISYIIAGFAIIGADYGILRLFHGYCNKKFLKVYVTITMLLGIYTKWACASFFIHKNKDESIQFLRFMIDPLIVIKETITNLSFPDLAIGLILLILFWGAKYAAIILFQENDVYCNNCNRWPEKIEFRLYADDIETILNKFNVDVNCLLELPLIDVFSIEEIQHNERYIAFTDLEKFDPPVELVINSKHIKVRIYHCLTCVNLYTISIYCVEYADGANYYIPHEGIGSSIYAISKEQFEAFQLKKNETKTDFCEILSSVSRITKGNGD